MPDPVPSLSAPAPSPLPPGEYAALVGLDWGDSQHAVALAPRGGAPVEKSFLPHSAETVHAWLEELARRFQGQRVAFAVEASKGAIVSALLEHPWAVVYPIHPATSRSYSKAFTPSGAKNVPPDARVLLELLQSHRERLRALLPQDPATRRVALLAEARRKLVERRTLLTNQLTSLLKNYYPQALDLVGDELSAPLTLAFLSRWPELAELQRACPQTLRAFYHGHQVRRPETIEVRLALAAQARPLTRDRVLCEVSILQLRALLAEVAVLNTHLAEADAAMARAFAAHPDAALFRSLPGAGSVMAPRLCVLFGSDRQRWSRAQELQTYYGIAPVTEQSGRQRRVHWRWSAPRFARQTLVEWAGLSVRFCDWAKAYYLQQKERGKGHSAILRSLAFKWLRVLWRCWTDHQIYDDARYLQGLKDRQVSFLKFLPVA